MEARIVDREPPGRTEHVWREPVSLLDLWRKAARAQSTWFGLVLLIVVTWAAFGAVGTGFLTSFNLYAIGQLASRDAVIGMAQALLIVVARMNLAVGSIGAVSASLLGYLVVVEAFPLVAALVCVCVVAVLASVLMGWTELRTRLSSFIVTLAFLSIYGGGALLLTMARQYTITSSTLERIGSGTAFTSGICPLVLVALACGTLVWLLYNHTSLGWKMLSIGANERAARASGVNVSNVLLATYAISGLLCAIGAIMESSYEMTVNASLGSDWLLPSFIAPVLGGAALAGGEISIPSLIFAAVFYDSLQSGLTIVNVPTYWLTFAEGLVLLGAVLLDRARRQRRPRRVRATAGSSSVPGQRSVAVAESAPS